MLGDYRRGDQSDRRALPATARPHRRPALGWDREIPVILDELADPEFGTGVVKGHARARSQRFRRPGRRHNLAKIQVIGEDGVNYRRPAVSTRGWIVSKPASKWLADLCALGALVKTERATR